MYEPEDESVRRWGEYMDTLYEEGFYNALLDIETGFELNFGLNTNQAYRDGYWAGVQRAREDGFIEKPI